MLLKHDWFKLNQNIIKGATEPVVFCEVSREQLSYTCNRHFVYLLFLTYVSLPIATFLLFLLS